MNNTKNPIRFILIFVLIAGFTWSISFLYTRFPFSIGLGVEKILAAESVYYIDADIGSDANPGTSSDLAWRSLAKVNAQTFQGGDSVLFKRGNQWQGGIILKILGNETIPVTIGTYGDTASSSPILNGSVTAPLGWNQVGLSSIYSLSLASSFAASSFKQVIVDGNRLDPARTPNTGYFTIDQVVSPTSFISSSATSIFTANGIGSTTVYFRTANWRVDKRTVTAFDPATNIVTFDSPVPTGYTLVAGQGFYLMNSRSFIDQAGEWFYDDITKELFVWLRSSDSPDAHVVELSTTQYGIYSGDQATVVVQDLTIKNFAKNGIRLVNNNSTITGNTISNSLERGISAGSKNITIQNNLITDSYQGGIVIFRADYVDTVNIESNTLQRNGSLGNQANPGQDIDGMSIYYSVAVTIANNIIRDSGNSGITASTITGSLSISSNIIQNYCLYLNDCGAIHLNGNDFGPTVSPQIMFNNIKNGVGDNGGTIVGTEKPYRIIVSGVYLDGYASNANVHNNTVDRSTGHGAIYLHGGNNNIIDSNTVYQYSTWPTVAFLKDPDTRFSPPRVYSMSGNIISNNQFFVEKIFNNVQDMQFYNTADTDSNFGTFTNNTINSDLTTAITSPQANTTVSGAVTINADASSTKSMVSKVEFYVDGGLIATDTSLPYSALWNTTSFVHNSNHILLAKVYDTVGNTATSSDISVKVVDITPPAVSIISPLNNSRVNRNSTVTISANASDISGISKVEFYVNSNLKCTATIVPYSCAWKVPAQKNITYTLQAKAYDLANNVGTSDTVKVISK